ncbi:MAG: glutamate mutase L [Bacillota bacterium]
MRPRTVLAIDVGSTTSKAILLGVKDGKFGLIARGQAPTTVEAPSEDVMVGVRNAVRQVEATTGLRLLDNDRLLTTDRDGAGVDLFVATSSAGGGLQMAVAGVIKTMTAESANRAALGAGAIVMDVISIDDARLVVERIRRLKEFRPDMILLAGGTDHGNTSHVLAVAEYVQAAHPQPRFGTGFKVPVIYAGNVNARDYVSDILSETMDVRMVDNIRPTLEREDLEPARAEIHKLFLEHVMAHAPGYRELLDWSRNTVMPTPTAVGSMMKLLSQRRGRNVLGVDIGGATTDVFSVMDGTFNRTVSANLGMSYSMANVMVEAKPERVLQWLPFETTVWELQNWTGNKMIRPTTLPQTLEELMLEHAMAREALRLSIAHHRSVVAGLKGVKQKRSLDAGLAQETTGQSLIVMNEVGIIIGSGGVLSHAPRRSQAALILIDSIEPEGITELYVDSVFMLPQLGALAEADPDAALEAFEGDCLVPLGTCICPAGPAAERGAIAKVLLTFASGRVVSETVEAGILRVIPCPAGEEVGVEILPGRGYDAGEGKGRRRLGKARGGEIGLVLDGRGRPLKPLGRGEGRLQQVRSWLAALEAYPAEAVSGKGGEA